MEPPRDAFPETSAAPAPPTTAGASATDPEKTVATVTPDPGPTVTAAADATDAEIGIPSHVGRYCVRAVLGEGGFGRVYLAYDEQLERQVAVKVPHRRLVLDPEAAACLPRRSPHRRQPRPPEHRAGLRRRQHGRFPCFIVSKYIEGRPWPSGWRADAVAIPRRDDPAGDVRSPRRCTTPTCRGSSIATSSRATSCSTRPGRPFVADFGLALRESNFGTGPRLRRDARVHEPRTGPRRGAPGRWPLRHLQPGRGLLRAARPGAGRSGPTRGRDCCDQIAEAEPRPPRQLDDAIPRELERICLKALAKRASERYATAMDMADDLRHFLASAARPARRPTAINGQPGTSAGALPAASRRRTRDRRPSRRPPALKVVPRGLAVLRCRTTPTSSWTCCPARATATGCPRASASGRPGIEETDADEHVPRGADLRAVRLRQVVAGQGRPAAPPGRPRAAGLRRGDGGRDRGPAADRPGEGAARTCPATEGLAEALAALRRGQGLPAGKKVLIVLDQFEQWLHAEARTRNAELVRGPAAVRRRAGAVPRHGPRRLLDGGHPVHAGAGGPAGRGAELRGRRSLPGPATPRRCWRRSGGPSARLPESPPRPARAAATFLEQAVAGLAQEGKVICVPPGPVRRDDEGQAVDAGLAAGGGRRRRASAPRSWKRPSAPPTAPPEHRYHQESRPGGPRAACCPKPAPTSRDTCGREAELLAALGLRRPPARLRRPAPHPRRRAPPDHADRPGRGGGWRVEGGGRRASDSRRLLPPPSTRHPLHRTLSIRRPPPDTTSSRTTTSCRRCGTG